MFIQHVTPGAFVAGLTLLTGLPSGHRLVKAALFGLAAGLIACYKGISVGGGPAGVGNAVNETVVLLFMALFVINVLATAVGVRGDDVSVGTRARALSAAASRARQRRSAAGTGSARRPSSTARPSARSGTRSSRYEPRSSV